MLQLSPTCRWTIKRIGRWRDKGMGVSRRLLLSRQSIILLIGLLLITFPSDMSIARSMNLTMSFPSDLYLPYSSQSNASLSCLLSISFPSQLPFLLIENRSKRFTLLLPCSLSTDFVSVCYKVCLQLHCPLMWQPFCPVFYSVRL